MRVFVRVCEGGETFAEPCTDGVSVLGAVVIQTRINTQHLHFQLTASKNIEHQLSVCHLNW